MQSSSRPTAPMAIASKASSYGGSRLSTTSIRRLPPLPSSPDSSYSSSSDETERPTRGPRPLSSSSTDSSSSDETVLSPYHPQRSWKRDSRRSSIRPLPPIPRALRCRRCATVITSINLLLPLHDIPENSRRFRGFSGKASLFTEIEHTNMSPPKTTLMASGAHTTQDISCACCQLNLGWHIVRAHEKGEEWKNGYYLLELSHLVASKESHSHKRMGLFVQEEEEEDSC